MQRKLPVSLLALVFILLAGCANPALLTESGQKHQKDKKETDTGSGQVQFAWTNRQSSARSSQFRPHNIEDARKVVITVENSAGKEIITNKQLIVYQFSGTFISEPIALAADSYKLTGYLVLDQSGKVIFASPRIGSAKAHLVKHPLPLDFTIKKDQKTHVTPEVIDTDETPAQDFGYATFSFNVIKTFDFLVLVMIFDPGQNKMLPTKAVLHISNDSYSYNFNLSAAINRISVNDIEGNFKIAVKKTGYQDYTATYTTAQLKSFFKDPLVVLLTADQPLPQFKEAQAITTHGAIDWEYFTIGSNKFLVVANYCSDSKIYKYNGSKFVKVQSIPTHKACDWEYFTIGNKKYLAVASFSNTSKIYKYNGCCFAKFQSIPTNQAFDWEYFTIGSNKYLAVANYYNDSKIYKYNGCSFVKFQSIPTHGARDWKYFTIGNDRYLALANSFNDSNVSKIYKYNGSKFVEFQSIPTSKAYDWEYFTIGSDRYLAVANHNKSSKIYKYNGSKFAEFQSIPTQAARDWEYFTIDNDRYLAVASYSKASKIYKYNGSSFVEFQFIPTHSARDWEYFTIGNDRYLAVSNFYNNPNYKINSKIYKAVF